MPSNDLISRKYIIKELLEEREKFPAMVEERYSFGVKIPRKFNQALRGGIRKALRIVETAPAVDAEPVRRGRYGFVGMDMMAGTRAFYFGTCSECRERINFEANHKNYCPNCGAKMKEE